MTAIASSIEAAPRAGSATALGRVWNAVRVHAANPWTTIYTPWLVVVTIFAMTYAVWQIIISAAGGRSHVDAEGFQYNGGVTWVIFFIMVLAIQAMNQSFRFALGFSMTRRDYYVGTVVHFALLAVMFGVGIAVLAGLERATGGWGVDGAFFAPWVLRDAPLWEVAYVFAALIALMFGLGIAFGTAFVRWKATGVLTVAGTLLAALIGGAWLVTRTNAWGQVRSFFTDQSLGAVVSWGLVPAAVLTALGYLLMRRATP
jgi:hypothetical protein